MTYNSLQGIFTTTYDWLCHLATFLYHYLLYTGCFCLAYIHSYYNTIYIAVKRSDTVRTYMYSYLARKCCIGMCILYHDIYSYSVYCTSLSIHFLCMYIQTYQHLLHHQQYCFPVSKLFLCVIQQLMLLCGLLTITTFSVINFNRKMVFLLLIQCCL